MKLPPIGTLGPFLALLAACAFFASQSDRFLTGGNLSLILQQVMVVGVIAIGQTLVILTAGIDLSCGMVMALGGIVMTKFATELGLPPVLAVACGLGVTTLFGLINGLLVTRIKLPPFIVTLGTLNIAFAITQLYSNSQTVTDLPPLLTALGNTFKAGGTEVAYGAVAIFGGTTNPTWATGWKDMTSYAVVPNYLGRAYQLPTTTGTFTATGTATGSWLATTVTFAP